MAKPRHIPIRTCVACRTTDEKRDLLRVVRQPDGSVRYDPKGKLSGRGAYVCARVNCIALARKQKKLERSLKVSHVPEALFIELTACVPEAGSSGTEEAPLPSDVALDAPASDLPAETAASRPQESEGV